jgi:hypothetical protein
LQRLIEKVSTFEDIEQYLTIDNVEEKQKNKMLRELEKDYKRLYIRKLDIALDKIQEVLEMPDKWTLTPEQEIVTVYPHPVLNNNYKVVDVAYRP